MFFLLADPSLIAPLLRDLAAHQRASRNIFSPAERAVRTLLRGWRQRRAHAQRRKL
jgi:hypothetical protein